MAERGIIDLKGGNGLDPFLNQSGNFFIVDSFLQG
jgi:hypothetical protein